MPPSHTRAPLFALLATSLTAASATVISYERDHLGDDDWRFRYTINNDSLGQPIRAITIYFNDSPGSDSPADLQALFSEDELSSMMDQLVELAGSSGTDGLRALGATGVDPGATAGTLVAEFTWRGDQPPAAQFFEVFRYRSPNDFDPSDILDSGYTTPVSQPATPVLIALGVFGIAVGARRNTRAQDGKAQTDMRASRR